MRESWRRRAACRPGQKGDEDGGIAKIFARTHNEIEYTVDENGEERGSRAGYRQAVLAALAICGTCPISGQCLENAIVNREIGVWGMTTLGQRDDMRRLRA